MEQWLHKNKPLILELQRLCGEHGCSGNVPGEVVMFLLEADQLREAEKRSAAKSSDIIDAHVAEVLRQELPRALADWVLANLWAHP